MKYQPKQGDLICYRQSNRLEYSLVCCENDEFLTCGIHRGEIFPESNFIKWIKLGGRWVYQIACSNPPKPIKSPEKIYKLKNIRKGIEHADLEKEISFAPYSHLWNSATQVEKNSWIKEYVKFIESLSTFKPISEKKLESLIEKTLSTPLEYK